ncbi:serine protease [Marmoricola endophyticus]|uniref:Serine protease n=1 Tax=Marmoricola endophyticus TaxID=2040280 RepID=A0A917BAG4_9ACTN|nr:S53 family peptidase [Marmoricola endophyticus]GGF34498.1 serine protease [Marmoricola endophyticus]
MRRTRTSLCAATVIGALIATGVGTAPAHAADRKRVARSAPSWVASAQAKGQAKGRAAAKNRSSFRLYLAPKGGVDALEADALARSTPGTSSYGTFLTAAQYHAAYDPSSASVKTVRGFLADNGLTVSGVGPAKRYLSVTGTNAAVEKAFATTMGLFTHDGEQVQTNTTDISVPASLAPLVIGVTGLDTETRTMSHRHLTGPAAPPSAGFRNARPCSRSYGQVAATYQADFKTPLPQFKNKTLPYAVCGYTGPQLRAAYEQGSTLDGTGTNVAVVDAYASPTIAKDAQTYATQHGDGGYANGQLTQVTPAKFTHAAQCDPSGWYGEETLDVEAVHAMAPSAGITYYGAASCFDDDFVDTLAQVVDDDDADVVTNSWGETEAGESAQSVAAFEQTFLQAAEQGISVTFSSGDNGDELQNTGIKQADYPASDPYVTAVGGTADAIDATGSFAFQAGWGSQKYTLSKNGKAWKPNGYLYGAGGGSSSLFNQPAYQQGVVPKSYGSSRSVPDMAMDADPTTGFLVGQTQTFPEGRSYDEYRIGGTSLASPLFAGMSALRQQSAGKRLGLQNPAIYAAAGTSSYSDVKGTPKDAGNVRVDYVNGLDAADGLTYTIRTFGQDASLDVRRGYDQNTGIGSPTAAWLTAK